MVGAALAGWDDITGIEMNQDYVTIAVARLKHWKEQNEAAKRDAA
jgi:hypothetical protein